MTIKLKTSKDKVELFWLLFEEIIDMPQEVIWRELNVTPEFTPSFDSIIQLLETFDIQYELKINYTKIIDERNLESNRAFANRNVIRIKNKGIDKLMQENLAQIDPKLLEYAMKLTSKAPKSDSLP